MTRLADAHLVLSFHLADALGADKRVAWGELNAGPYDEPHVALFLDHVLDGRVLSDYERQMLSVFARPGPPSDGAWAAQMAAAGGNTDTEAAHADADRLLVNLVHKLGYVRTAEAYNAVEKWYA